MHLLWSKRPSFLNCHCIWLTIKASISTYSIPMLFSKLHFLWSFPASPKRTPLYHPLAASEGHLMFKWATLPDLSSQLMPPAWTWSRCPPTELLSTNRSNTFIPVPPSKQEYQQHLSRTWLSFTLCKGFLISIKKIHLLQMHWQIFEQLPVHLSLHIQQGSS